MKSNNKLNALIKHPRHIQIGFVAVLLLSLFGSCAYNAGKPWNCQEAQEIFRKAQSDYDSIVKQEAVSDRTVLAYANSLFKAQAKQEQLCK